MRALNRLSSFSASAFFPWCVAAAISVLLSFWQISTRDIINSDGLCYLQSAWNAAHFHALAMQTCEQSGWPFYHVLIGLMSRLSGCSVLMSANALNTFFSMCSVLIFVAIVHTLTDSKRIIWFAVGTILLAHHFNAYRADVIRDHGFWALYLFSLYALLRFVTARLFIQQAVYALFWNISLLLAILFRFEGVIFWIVLPWIVTCCPHYSQRQRIRTFCLLNCVLIVMIPLIWMVAHYYSLGSFGKLAYFVGQITHGWDDLLDHWDLASQMMGRYVLNPYSAHDAGWMLIFALMGYYVVSIFDVLTIAYCGLIVYGLWCRRSIFVIKPTTWVILAYLLINVLITTFFLAQHFFLARRYMMPLGITAMLFVPFALEDVWRRCRGHRWPLWLVVSAIAICSIGGVIRFGASHRYVQESAAWLSIHTPSSTNIYSNDRVLLYYLHRPSIDLFASRPSLASLQQTGDWRQYDWLAVRQSHDEASYFPFHPTAIFKNSRGGEVRIYHVKNQGIT